MERKSKRNILKKGLNYFFNIPAILLYKYFAYDLQKKFRRLWEKGDIVVDDSGESPVIVIGMHRSGTSLLSENLAELGVFNGWYQGTNNESFFFRE